MKRLFKISLISVVLFFAACSVFSTRGPTRVIKSMEDIPDVGLSGKLVLVKWYPGGNQLIELDLTSGRVRTLFQAPKDSLLLDAEVSPDSQQILLSYSPPADVSDVQYGYTDLYLLPYGENEKPQPLLSKMPLQEAFFFPTWAPNGQSIFFTHLHRTEGNGVNLSFQHDIESTDLTGDTKMILERAQWPTISPDGKQFSYLVSDQSTLANQLYLANIDGTNQKPVLDSADYPAVDAHLFSNSGTDLIFSMVNQKSAPTSSWIDKFLGVRIASAHSVPSDWYRVSVNGGIPKRLTYLNEMNLDGDISPDGNQLAFISSNGLYVMNIDGSELIQLSKDVMIGSVNWIP